MFGPLEDQSHAANNHFLMTTPVRVLWDYFDDCALNLDGKTHYDQFETINPPKFSSRLLMLKRGRGTTTTKGYYIMEKIDTKSGTQRLNRMSRRNQMNRSSERKRSYSSTFSSTFSSTSVSSMSVLTNNEADDAAGIVDVRSKKYGADFTAIDEHCTCYTCQRYTKSYLHHLFRSSRVTCQHLIALHNMHYTCRVIARLCGEDESLAEKVRRMFPLVEPDLSSCV